MTKTEYITKQDVEEIMKIWELELCYRCYSHKQIMIGDVFEKMKEKVADATDWTNVLYHWSVCNFTKSLQEIEVWEYYDPNPPCRETAQRLRPQANELFSFLKSIFL